MRYVALLLLAAAAPLSALERISLPDGTDCWRKPNGHVFGCKEAPQETRRSPPSTCQEAQQRVDEISDNLRGGLGAGEYEEQKQLRRRYREQIRADCP